MARDHSVLTSTSPTGILPATVTIGHVQLRDLIICPRERGVVNYVSRNSIVEHDLATPNSTPRPIAKLSFLPNTLASLPVRGTEDLVLAVGGQDAEIHLSYLSPLARNPRQYGALWSNEYNMSGSINNSVLLTSMSLTRSNESGVEPRLGISNNDCTFKFYNIPIRGPKKRDLDEVGSLQLCDPINHSSISPDGRTLLSVGDSAKVYLHQMTGGAGITFSPIATLKLPPPTVPSYSATSLTASFSTAFSSDGSKFAVASQEGLLAVWDVRSSKPMKVFHTGKSRVSAGNGGASGWLTEEPVDWVGGGFRAPGWSVRNVKFGGSGDKEIMSFTEHTSLFHVVDARTFETEEIIQIPSVKERPEAMPAQPPPTHLPPPYPRYSRRSAASRNRSPMSISRTPLEPLPPPRHSVSPDARPNTSQSRTQILRALGDTFRIYSPPSSISDSTWRALRMSDSIAGVNSSANNAESDYNDILIIPPFGDPMIESDVQALLGSHGIRTRTASTAPVRPRPTSEGEDNDPNTGSNHGDYEYTPRRTYTTVNSRRGGRADDIEVDELESDCTSSLDPSRSSSPSPSAHAPVMSSPFPARLSSPPVGIAPPCTISVSEQPSQHEVVYVDNLDIAGTCFDPTGRNLYVASTESVGEWSVRGADKRWWAGSQWM